jgi:hypothetical protein
MVTKKTVCLTKHCKQGINLCWWRERALLPPHPINSIDKLAIRAHLCWPALLCVFVDSTRKEKKKKKKNHCSQNQKHAGPQSREMADKVPPSIYLLSMLLPVALLFKGKGSYCFSSGN